MKKFSAVIFVALAGAAYAGELELTAAKDTFGRSSQRIRNSGASAQLAIANAPNIRTLIAFDLGSVTNEITGAEFRFRQNNTVPERISMVVAPMVNTARNAVWLEGVGDLGAIGHISRSGEACYAYSAFSDVPWESAPNKPVVNLGDSNLWKPAVASLNGLLWEENRWVKVPISDTALLEAIRTSETPVITFGLWGKSGNGIYFLSSRNSASPPVLHLDLKEVDKK